MSSLSQITPPQSLGDALVPLADMADGEFSTLLSAVSGAKSFSLTKDEIGRLEKEMLCVGGQLTFLLGSVAFLYSRIEQVVELGVDRETAVHRLVAELADQGKWTDRKELMTQRLSVLLAYSEKHLTFRKRQRLQLGFLPNATGFSSFVDLRPDFADEGPLEIRQFVKMIQFRISTDAESPAQRRFVFQMSEESLGELKKAVDKAVAKLDAIKKNSAVSSSLID